MRAHEFMLRNISIGYIIARENRVMASIKKRRIPLDFYRLDLLYFSTFLILSTLLNISRSIAYLVGIKVNYRKSVLHDLFKCRDYMYFFHLPLF